MKATFNKATNELTITIPVDPKSDKVSSTGKSVSIGSTGGNQPWPAPDGSVWKIGVNVFKAK